MLFSLRRLRAVSAWALVLVFVLAAPASAQGGFQELTLAEIGENTATCDFSGGTDYADYWVADYSQTVLQKTTSTTDAQGYTHLTIVTRSSVRSSTSTPTETRPGSSTPASA